MTKFHMAFVGLAFLAGCPDGTVTTDSGDSGGSAACPSGDFADEPAENWAIENGACVYVGPYQIAEISYDCGDTTADYWTYMVIADGWARNMTLDIFETGSWGGVNDPTTFNGWEEFHPMNSVQFAPDRRWDEWDLSLSIVSTTGEQTSGSSSLFACSFDDGGSLAWMATMLDDNADVIDCGVWGNEAVDYFNTTEGNSCFDFGSTNDAG